MLNCARSLRGLLLLSGLILTVHTLVPHVHEAHSLEQGEKSINPEQKVPSSWLDILTDLVDAEMGEDHLEHFSPHKTLDFVLVVPTIIPALPTALFAERFLFQPETAVLPEAQTYSSGPKTEEVHLRSLTLRGPPTMA